MKTVALIGTTAESMINFRGALIKWLVAMDYKVICLAIDYDATTKQAIIELGGFPVPYSLDRSSVNPFRLLSDILSLRAILTRYTVDSVLCFFTKPVLVTTLAFKLGMSGNCIAMLEGLGSTFTDSSFRVGLTRRIFRAVQANALVFGLRSAEKVVLLNKDDYCDLRRYGANLSEQKVVILNGIGVDLTKFRFSELPDLAEGFHCIFVGRLIAEKGIFEFVQMARQLSRRIRNIRFTIVGDVDLCNPSGLPRVIIDELAKAENLDLLGFRDDIFELLQSAHVLVHPSYREGFPKAVMEAMATGRPVVAFDVPGSRSALVSGTTGMLVKPGDVDGLSNAVERLSKERSLLVAMSTDARAHAEKHFDEVAAAEVLGTLLVAGC